MTLFISSNSHFLLWGISKAGTLLTETFAFSFNWIIFHRLVSSRLRLFGRHFLDQAIALWIGCFCFPLKSRSVWTLPCLCFGDSIQLHRWSCAAWIKIRIDPKRSYSPQGRSLKQRGKVLSKSIRTRIIGSGTCVSWVSFTRGILWMLETFLLKEDGKGTISKAETLQRGDFLQDTVYIMSYRAG